MKADVDSIKDDWLTDNARLIVPSNFIPWLTCSLLGDRLLARVNLHSISTTSAFHTHVSRYIEREELGAFPKAQIVLLRPSMSYLLQHTPDPMTLRSVLPDFTHTSHIFLPINDSPDPTHAEGGSHWSLLLVSIIDGVSFHYDSLSPSNHREARNTSIKLEQLLQKKLKFIHMDDAPQQENGSDCGVFVCILTKHLLLKRLLRADATRKISMSMKDQRINAQDGRKTMLKMIESRKKEGERRRS
jgi:sentrin-specific protease 8